MAEFSEELWAEVLEVANASLDPSKRPIKRSKEVINLGEKLRTYAESVTFVAEFPSLRGIPCSCQPEDNCVDKSSEDTSAIKDFSLKKHALTLQRCSNGVQGAYNLLRRPGKELLLTVASDINRVGLNGIPIPIQFFIGGYSLKMHSVRQMLDEAISRCEAKGLNVVAVAFDGQFLEVSICESERPLTICKLQKSVWEEARKLTKSQQISYFQQQCSDSSASGLNEITKESCIATMSCSKYVTFYAPKNVTIEMFGKRSKEPVSEPEIPEITDDFILQHLSDGVIEQLSSESISLIREVSTSIASAMSDKGSAFPETNRNLHDDESQCPSRLDFRPRDEDYEAILCALIAGSKSSKWAEMSLEQFKSVIATGPLVAQHFTLQDLKIIIDVDESGPCKGLKASFVNHVVRRYGDGTTIQLKTRVKSLKTIVLDTMNSFPKQLTNILYATNMFPKRLREWEASAYFRPDTIISTDENGIFRISRWYAQPSMEHGRPIQPIIDPHHLYVNNRCRTNSFGMPGMGIRKDAWVFIAENEKENQTGLTVEHVIELRDRQRNAFAMLNFSEEVEQEMIKQGYAKEAEWCGLIRNWYAAVDESGIGINQRVEWLLEMRNFLLGHYNPMQFPPPGSHIKGLPIAQFEGILCNVDRRLQLYETTKEHSYNHRSISSLDSESIFGGIQVCWHSNVIL